MDILFKLLPEQATEYAKQVDELYLFILGLSTLLTILFFVLLVGFSIKYRRRANETEKTEPPHEHYSLEIISGTVFLVLLMVMFFWGAKLYFRAQRAPADAMEVLVSGKQWMWKLQHPSGKKEINTLHIPVNRAVKLTMTSEDVIHSFFIPAFRVKNDALPGRYTQVWFKPNKEGTFHLFCTEYCGTEHSRMVGYVKVVSEEAYERWAAGLGEGDETPVQAGERLFAEHGCITCHGGVDALPKGSKPLGAILNNIIGKEVTFIDGTKLIRDDNYLRESILNPLAKIVDGYAPMMPTYQGVLNEEQLGQLIAYIKSLSDN
jgi:cytochrome c oxidase subunit 2